MIRERSNIHASRSFSRRMIRRSSPSGVSPDLTSFNCMKRGVMGLCRTGYRLPPACYSNAAADVMNRGAAQRVFDGE